MSATALVGTSSRRICNLARRRRTSRRMWERLEAHYPARHGRRLNMARTKLSALSEQCQDQRINEVTVLRNEVGAWEGYRNRTEARVRWRFTTEDARIQLEKLYPVFEIPRTPWPQLPAELIQTRVTAVGYI
jgi:hypothetical protein